MDWMVWAFAWTGFSDQFCALGCLPVHMSVSRIPNESRAVLYGVGWGPWKELVCSRVSIWT
jgi:hypothetical protein